MESVDSKKVYPNVLVSLEVGGNERNRLSFETYVRLKHRGKYYLTRHFKEFEIKTGLHTSQLEIISHMSHFYAGVYKGLLLAKVNLKLVVPGEFDRPVFVLDKDQRSEKERMAE